MRTPLEGHTIGFVGLGLMGQPMSLNLHAAGAEVVAWNRSRGPLVELAAQGLRRADSAREVATRAATVVLMLADTPAVESVVEGEAGLLDAIDDGTLVVDMGTTAVEATRRLAARVRDAGGDWLDAPVSGGVAGAEAGSLSIMAGGEPHALERAMPLFDVLGARVTHVGEVGAGQIAKTANQIVVGLTIGAVAEALALARRAGADPAKVRAALGGGFADSRILEVHGQRMIDGDYTPGARCTTQRKDLRQALDLAEGLGIELPATALCRTLYDRLIEAGGADLDHSALLRVIEA